MAGFGTYPPAVVLLSLQECLSWGQGTVHSFSWGRHSGPMQKPKSEMKHVFHSLGGLS